MLSNMKTRLSIPETATYIHIFVSNVNNLRHRNITLMEYIFQWNRLINFVNRFQMGVCVFIYTQAIVTFQVSTSVEHPEILMYKHTNCLCL